MLNTLFLLQFILLICANQVSNEDINAVDNIIEKNVIEVLNKARKCFDPESCANQLLNGLAFFDDRARFKGILAFCNENRKELKIDDVFKACLLIINKKYLKNIVNITLRYYISGMDEFKKKTGEREIQE